MGLAQAQPMKGNDGFFWEGSKNLAFYEKEFEINFLAKTRLIKRVEQELISKRN